jgi:hypothetical protein
MSGYLEKEAKLNYSKALQDGLMARLGIEREINHRPGRKKTRVLAQTPSNTSEIQ